ncbi:MAG: B12-binding domain-containing radical SAM protein, partial [Candidatus Helarchaeota archaeon]
LRECGAEFVVIGEGELTLLELMEKWQDEEGRKQIKGIAYLEDGQFKRNPDRELIANLDDLPFPAWDLINPRKYPPEPHGRVMKRYPVAPIFTTRGCPYSCAYCASTQFWRRKFRKRSAKNIVDEIEYLVKTFGIREIHIWDDNFTLRRDHVINFCREVLKRKLDLAFACPNGVRIDHLDKNLLTIMKRAGFYSLTFAIESGSQTILNNMNKKIDLKVIPKMAKIAKSLDYIIPAFFMVGFPGETYETARRTIQFAKSLPLDRFSFFVVQPLPGSNLFAKWIKTKHTHATNYEFYTFKDKIVFHHGKRKLKLPKDALREFYFRPRQIIRGIVLDIKLFQIRQFMRRVILIIKTLF